MGNNGLGVTIYQHGVAVLVPSRKNPPVIHQGHCRIERQSAKEMERERYAAMKNDPEWQRKQRVLHDPKASACQKAFAAEEQLTQTCKEWLVNHDPESGMFLGENQ
jgi:hypothetical protein